MIVTIKIIDTFILQTLVISQIFVFVLPPKRAIHNTSFSASQSIEIRYFFM